MALVRSFRDGRVDDTARLQLLLDELIARLSVFPTPWGIRIALEARGLPTGPLPLPLTPARREQIREFQSVVPRVDNDGIVQGSGIRDQQELRASGRTVLPDP